MAEQIIKMSSFPYKGKDGIERTALRGDKVDITDEIDLERGERLGVFATDDDLKPGTVFGDFYVAHQANLANLKAAEDAGMPELVEQPEQPPAEVPPGKGESREKWVAWARTKDAPDSELVPVEEGGLTRDKLREKYGTV